VVRFSIYKMHLKNLLSYCKSLIPLHADTEAQLKISYQKHPIYNECDEEASEEFNEIIADLHVVEHKIKLKAQVACLMSAVQAEENINEFCVFNLHKEIAESIEKLSSPEKLTVACSVNGEFEDKRNCGL
jgi:hypothetical protein